MLKIKNSDHQINLRREMFKIIWPKKIKTKKEKKLTEIFAWKTVSM
jgi:hypothetical protein